MSIVKKRFLAIFISALVLCINIGTTCFAAEPEIPANATCYTLELTSDGIASIHDENGDEVPENILRSSISGYDSKGLTSSDPTIIVYTSSSGIGGMGITIKTTSSWNGYMSLTAALSNAGNPFVEDYAIYSNDEVYFNNFMHFSPSYVAFRFDGIPRNQTVNVQIWIYG